MYVGDCVVLSGGGSAAIIAPADVNVAPYIYQSTMSQHINQHVSLCDRLTLHTSSLYVVLQSLFAFRIQPRRSTVGLHVQSLSFYT